MKKSKFLSFLRSMRFGMLLLTLIAALSIVGTLITQGQSEAFYTQAYGSAGSVILFFGADHIYATWYYVALFIALCVNLTLCSLVRMGKLRGAKAALGERAKSAPVIEGLAPDAAQAACKSLGFKRGGEGLYIRHGAGVYGSFVAHLGMLLLVIAAACVFALEDKQDAYVMPGDTLTLADGCAVTVNSFAMENEAGQLDYISQLTLTGEDGAQRDATITVNHPARFGEHTVYQQSYAFAGVLDVKTAENAQDERIVLDGPAFISLDGVSGVHYMQVYGDYTTMADGQLMPMNSTGMNNPVYLMALIDGETQTMGVTLPDETFEVGGVYFTFRAPQAYPGLRVKTQPLWVTPLLYASFAVLVAGLYLCFFCVPAAISVAGGAVRVYGAKGAEEIAQQMKDEAEA